MPDTEKASNTVNPIKRELIRNALVTIADNMIVTVIRTSRSIVVKNNLDFSSCICDAEGQLVAQGLALPAHLGAMMPALKGCMDFFGDDIHSGDILASNDPYSGASHLNDVFMFAPVYSASGVRIAFVCLILHHTDMGGRVPGGNAADSTEIFQEGLRIPPSKIYEAGKPNPTLFNIIKTNVRVPDMVIGDMRSQISALKVAERELVKLFDDYDPKDLKIYMSDLIDYSERLTRAGIAALPDGSVDFTDWNDDDGAGSGPVKFQVRLTVKGDEITVDFTGTSPQTSGALNPNFWFTASCSFAAIRTVLDGDIPNNAGFFRPIKVIAPEGCFVNPLFPAPVGARGQGAYRVRSVVLGALAQLLPDRMPACPGGSEMAIVFAGYNPDRSPFLLLEFHNMTGLGGGPRMDGQEAGPYCLGNVANVSVEVIEAESPVMVEEYAFLPDTGGPGTHRGALGIVRQFRLLAEKATVQVRSDRQKHKPWGLQGGGGGALGKCIMDPATDDEAATPSKFIGTMKRGQVFRGEMPGSGGHGDPFKRDVDAVLEDVHQEKVSLEHARTAYGVVINDDGVDVAATAKLRSV
jgi:N-methylhydantoinase B